MKLGHVSEGGKERKKKEKKKEKQKRKGKKRKKKSRTFYYCTVLVNYAVLHLP